MEIIKKSEAMKILKSNPNFITGRYDRGKYKWLGSEKHYIGKATQELAEVKAVYVERRSGAELYGLGSEPYCVIKCVYDSSNEAVIQVNRNSTY